MSFSFSTPALPRSVRVCRSLVWIQAALSVLTGAFVVLVSLLFGNGDSIPIAGGALTGAGAVALGAGYVAAGVVVAWLGAELGRPARWVPALLAGAEVLLTALALLRSFDLSIGTVLNVALAVAIVAILVAPVTASSAPRDGTEPAAPTLARVSPVSATREEAQWCGRASFQRGCAPPGSSRTSRARSAC